MTLQWVGIISVKQNKKSGHMCSLAYVGCARSTSSSQKWAVLRKRHDNSLFLRSWQKKDITKVALASSNSKLENSVFNLTRSTYFVENNTTIILPGDTRRTSSELPCQTTEIHFWRQIRSLETQNVSYFSIFTFDMVFGIVNPLYLQWEKLPDFNAFPVNLHWRQDSKVFCRLLNPDWSIQIFGALAVCKESRLVNN